MRIVLQRVSSARVTVASEEVGAIGNGLLVLIGVTHYDTAADSEVLAHKLAGLRIFPDDSGHMNLSVSDVGGEVLVVSQFTLYGESARGRRPSFTSAAPGDVAEPLVEQLVERLRAAGLRVATGRFGAMMKVELVNDGPVTIFLETKGGRFLAL